MLRFFVSQGASTLECRHVGMLSEKGRVHPVGHRRDRTFQIIFNVDSRSICFDMICYDMVQILRLISFQAKKVRIFWTPVYNSWTPSKGSDGSRHGMPGIDGDANLSLPDWMVGWCDVCRSLIWSHSRKTLMKFWEHGHTGNFSFVNVCHEGKQQNVQSAEVIYNYSICIYIYA